MTGAEELGLACRLGRRFCFAEVSTRDPRPSARGFGGRGPKSETYAESRILRHQIMFDSGFDSKSIIISQKHTFITYNYAGLILRIQ